MVYPSHHDQPIDHSSRNRRLVGRAPDNHARRAFPGTRRLRFRMLFLALLVGSSATFVPAAAAPSPGAGPPIAPAATSPSPRAATGSPPPAVGGRPGKGRFVVAHFHTTHMPYSSGQNVDARYRDEVRAAMELGIDGFAVNAFNGSQANGTIKRLVDAASAIGATRFKLFLSADMSQGFAPAEIRDVITRWGANPHYLRVRNKPMLSTYGGYNKDNNWWKANVLSPLAAAKRPVTFVPYFDRGNPNAVPPTYEAWSATLDKFPAVDGLFNFLIPGSVPFYKGDPNLGHHWWSVLEGEENLARALHDRNKVFMAPYMPYYWASCRSARQYVEFRGGRGTENQWRSMISKQKPELVEIVTWNDWTESTHVQPTRIVPNYVQKGKKGIVGYPHLGYYELLKYYINWYLTDTQPTVTKDAVFYFHRTHPRGATATNDANHCSIPLVTRQLWGNVQDMIFVTTATKEPAELRVTTGSSTKTFKVPAGVTHTEVPFAPGVPKIELWRGSQRLTSARGTEIVARPEYYNYNLYSGYAVVGGATSGTWTATDTWKTGHVADWFR